MSTAPLTCAQVVALPPESWVNNGFQGVVLKIEPINKKAGGVFYKVTVGDAPGDYTSSVSLSEFTAPRYAVGDIIRITGKGIKRGDYQGKPQMSRGKESTVEVMPSAAKIQANVQAAITETRGQAAASHAEGMIPGVTVGMAMKEALALHSIDMGRDQLKLALTAPGWWSEVYATASDIIRVARLLETGKLCDPVRQRAASKPTPQHDPESELDAQEEAPF